jgi:hypothetical protein
MSVMEERLRAASEKIRILKTETAKSAQGLPGYGDIHPTLELWRGAEPVGFAVAHAIDKETGLALCRMLASGMDADMILLANDTIRSTHENNPMTGEPWKAGDMQDLMENHEGLEKGWVKECVSIWAANRAGDHQSANWCYRISGRGTDEVAIEWAELDVLPANSGSGYIIDKLVEAATMTSMGETMARYGVTHATFGISEEHARAIQDCQTAEMTMGALQIDGRPGVSIALFSEPDTERRAVIMEKFPDSIVQSHF